MRFFNLFSDCFYLRSKCSNISIYTYNFLVILLLITIFIAHLFQLDNIPAGLYLDETSIGYNAALISQTGLDEHDIYYPIYFKAFGEYKNPIYIYAVAIIFRFFGISEFNLRFTSFTFYIAGLTLTILLIAKIFRRNRLVEIYTLISFGFLPLFFTLSRISFEVISQLTWISGGNLLIWIIFHEQQRCRLGYLKAIGCGLILGTSIYTYSTARLLSLLMLISLWIVYFNRDNLKKLILTSLAFFTSLIPYIIFTINNPGATTTRFRAISYIDDSISILNKIYIFVHNLATYWSPKFLIIQGDSNLRHSTGYGGIIFSVTLLLFFVALVNIITNKKLNKFNALLLINLLLSPMAAALTSEGTPHALRSLLLGYYILLISCYGVKFLSEIRENKVKKVLIVSISVFLVLEIFSYQLDYFLFYPSKSIPYFESFDLKTSLQIAIEKNPRQIIFVNNVPPSYVNLQFYSYLVDNPKDIPIQIIQKPVPDLDTCFLYNQWYDQEFIKELDEFPHEFTEYETQKKISLWQKLLGAETSKGLTKVRCYGNSN